MDQSLAFFKHQQEQFSESFSDMMQNNPMKAFTEMNKQNMEMWRKISEGFYGNKKK